MPSNVGVGGRDYGKACCSERFVLDESDEEWHGSSKFSPSGLGVASRAERKDWDGHSDLEQALRWVGYEHG